MGNTTSEKKRGEYITGALMADGPTESRKGAGRVVLACRSRWNLRRDAIWDRRKWKTGGLRDLYGPEVGIHLLVRKAHRGGEMREKN